MCRDQDELIAIKAALAKARIETEKMREQLTAALKAQLPKQAAIPGKDVSLAHLDNADTVQVSGAVQERSSVLQPADATLEQNQLGESLAVELTVKNPRANQQSSMAGSAKPTLYFSKACLSAPALSLTSPGHCSKSLIQISGASGGSPEAPCKSKDVQQEGSFVAHTKEGGPIPGAGGVSGKHGMLFAAEQAFGACAENLSAMAKSSGKGRRSFFMGANCLIIALLNAA